MKRKESIAVDDAEKTFLFKLPSGNILKIDKLIYDDERMLPNAWVIEMVTKKDFEDCFDGTTLNKMPVWGKDNPITIHLNSDLK